MPGMDVPATCFSLAFDAAALAAEVPTALHLVAEVREIWPEIEGWVNFPLFNETGDAGDLRLALYDGVARPTPQAARMPATAAVVGRLQAEGFAVQQARIAVLAARECLRCHVDMYPAHRLIVPLNDQGDDFRHVFGDFCVAMRAGELWGVAGHHCHGAAHVAREGHRVALLVDAHPSAGHPPAWFTAPWQPPDRVLFRPELTSEKTREINQLPEAEAEAAWLMAPFEYALSPEAAYAELVAFWQRLGRPDRAAYWQQHACVCVPEPSERAA